MSKDADRLRAIQDELNGILESRITELLARTRALREVTNQIVATELDIRRNDQMKAQLEAELGPLGSRSGALEAENAELKTKVDGARANVERMRKLREEHLSIMSGLTSELKGLAGGS
jgi:chromosome segregation ATPase